MKVYGLRSKKKNCLMEFSITSNDGDCECCNSYSCELSEHIGSTDNMWLTINLDTVNKIASTVSPSWYNANFNSPMWNEKKYGKLEVVCINDL